jgi:hypothetical protein
VAEPHDGFEASGARDIVPATVTTAAVTPDVDLERHRLGHQCAHERAVNRVSAANDHYVGEYPQHEAWR